MKIRTNFLVLLFGLFVWYVPSKAEPVKFPEQGGWWIDDNRYNVTVRANRSNDTVEMYSEVDKTILIEVIDSKGNLIYFSTLKIVKNGKYQLPLNNIEQGDVVIQIKIISDDGLE